MANTFYQETQDISKEKVYIMREISFKCHTIWKSEKFWERALTSAVQNQLLSQEGVKWDDLEQSALTDLVISTHNLIFGQLGTLAFTMHELGLEFEEVVYRVQELCKIFELSEDRCFQIRASIVETYDLKGARVVKMASPSTPVAKTSESTYSSP